MGFGNVVNSDKLIGIIHPDSAPAKRLSQRAKEQGLLIDATQGRRTKSILLLEQDRIMLSALLPETLTDRFNLMNYENLKEITND